MSDIIKKLQDNITWTKSSLDTLESLLKDEYYKIFDDMQTIKDLVTNIESSDNYGIEDCHPHWICQCITTDNFQDIKKDTVIWEFLKEYLEDNHYIHTDATDNYFTYSCGPSIIIQYGGIVWDQDNDEVILDNNDYDDDNNARNKAIELYMEKTGHYPGVYATGYYGEVLYPVNTQTVED